MTLDTEGHLAQKTAMPAPMQILQKLKGLWEAMIIGQLARLELPDLLQNGPKTVGDLAKIREVNPDALYRFMRAASTLGLLQEIDTGHYEDPSKHVFTLTESSKYLCKQQPGSMHAMALMLTSHWEIDAWKNLDYSIRTGLPAFDLVHKMNIWQFMQQSEQDYHIFSSAMSSRSTSINKPIARSYDFSQFTSIIDVGGGQGSFLQTILQEYPSVTGTLFDSESVIDEAQKQRQQSNVGHRYKCIPGNFFQQIPSGADAYILKQIIQDWDTQNSKVILDHCRAAMQPGAKLLIIEHVLQEIPTDSHGSLVDIEMLVSNGGRMRTEREHRLLLQASGFNLIQVLPTTTTHSIVEGIAI